jgi:exopolysaccharide production protein ExoQ
MPPELALLLWFILLLALLYFDPGRVPSTSGALWVPVVWLFIVGSRLPSQWLGFQAASASQAFEQGNPLDRGIDLLLIVLAVVILVSRRFQWDVFFVRNLPLIAFIAFGLLSVVWSDFPFISLKRWFRDLGSYLVILVVLTDRAPLEAIRTVVRRLCYLLIPLSVLLFKYFPSLGRQYDTWSGAVLPLGATTSKNMLGALCLVSALFFSWDTITRWPDRRKPQSRRVILVNIAFLGMTLWLLKLSNSMTSRVCLVIGCLVLVATQIQMFKRHPGFLKVVIPSVFLLYLILAFGFGLNGELASQLGRDPTLTDRTLIWKTVLSTGTNPIVGTGYESFWLGPRLMYVWRYVKGISEAHNGYIDVYLNLGAIGVVLLVGVLLSSIKAIYKRLSSSAAFASFGLAVWTAILFYNMTEAAFKSGLLWMLLMLSAINVAAPAEERLRVSAPLRRLQVSAPFSPVASSLRK